LNTIEFPGLGLKFNIDRVAFEVFGLEIYWYGILIALGFILAVLLAMKHCRDFGIDQDTLLDAVLYATPVAIIFSRLYYVVFNWADFKDNPIDIINTRKGGLAIYGAVIGAILVGYVYTRIKKVNFLNLIDFCLVYFPLAQGIGRWGNFINQEAYGTHTNLPWGMDGSEIVNGPVHPTFLYESLWNMVAFFVLLWYRKRKKLDGEVLSLYLILYGVGRAWIELLRTDSLMIGNLKVNLLLSVVLVIVFMTIFIYRRTKLADLDMETEGGDSVYANILRKLESEEGGSAPPDTGQAEERAEESGIDEGTGDIEVPEAVSDDDAEKEPDAGGGANEGESAGGGANTGIAADDEKQTEPTADDEAKAEPAADDEAETEPAADDEEQTEQTTD
jgi:phosphatidylglycerol:prolipoprotein diacylglycerol transferase